MGETVGDGGSHRLSVWENSGSIKGSRASGKFLKDLELDAVLHFD